MKTLKLAAALLAIAIPVLFVANVRAQSGPPSITSITAQCSEGDKVCFTVTLSNPAPGSITLMLTAHTPGSPPFVDTGLHTTIDISTDQTTYFACFDNVSSVLQGHNYNSLRVEVFSSTVPNLEGTTTKSDSFTPCSVSPSPSPSASPSPSPSASPSPSPSTSPSASPSVSPSPSPSPSPSASASVSPSPSPSTSAGGSPSPSPSASGGGLGGGLALTGGLDYRLTLVGLLLILLGMAVFLIANGRRRQSGAGKRPPKP